jgi:integrase
LALALSPADKLDAVRAIQLLAGKTTLEAVAREWVAGRATLATVRTVLEVQNELVAAQVTRKNRAESIAATKTRYASFIEQYGLSPVAQIKTDDVTDWLESQSFTSDVTRANAMRYLAVFFNFAVKRGYITKSPMAGIERPRTRYSVPEFIPVADVERLLRTCEQHDPLLVAKLATGVFAGIRPTEVSRLLSSDIDMNVGVIHVRPEASKTGVPRHVTISQNLRLWLTKYPFNTNNSFDERRAKVCKIAGLTKWPNDALRHTFASYHLAMFQDAAKTAFELGHIGSHRILFRHYAGLASKDDALTFWSITPCENQN